MMDDELCQLFVGSVDGERWLDELHDDRVESVILRICMEL